MKIHVPFAMRMYRQTKRARFYHLCGWCADMYSQRWGYPQWFKIPFKEKNDASSMQEVRKDNPVALQQVPNVQPVAWLTRAEEEALSAQADYWEGRLRGDT